MSGYFFISSACLSFSADARQHEFVLEHAIVLDDEADLLAFADVDAVRR